MRLSQIKLAGFKSFVNPTHIALPGQIVGVVGPNGCGKSNVIDALRWVLGESKASALRGETMQDVIFNGSEQRKPVSRASVELIFDNSLGKAAGPWSSFAEISIRRLLQRNGDSSYYINHQHVRRKDVTDIFLGTGLGARAYAIIEQGMISRLIEARPEELRIFLEEAAGISRYRDRRREAELRINDTRDNLLRVSDILLELDQQLMRLKSQAEVARQYLAIEAQRDTAQHLLWLVRKRDAEVQRAGFAQLMEQTSTELEAEVCRLRDLEKRLEGQRDGHYQLSDALHARQGNVYAANAEIARLEQHLQHLAEQRQRLTLQIANLEKQSVQQQQQRQGTQTMLEHWQLQQDGACARVAETMQLAQQEDRGLPQSEQALRAAQEDYGILQREQLQLQQRMQLADTQRENVQRNIQRGEARRARLLLEKDNLPRFDGSALQLAQQQMAELETVRALRTRQLDSLQEQLPLADHGRRNLRNQLQQQERQLAQIEARQHALQQLQQHMDSDKRLHAWLQRHQLDKLPRLWQSLHIEPGWEDALEAVLRERLNAIALPLLNDTATWGDMPPLKLALYAPQTAPAAVRPEPAWEVLAESEDALTGSFRAGMAYSMTSLLSYVRCQDEQTLPILCDWLARVYVQPDLVRALALRAQLPPGGWFITPAGHLVGAHSVLFHAPDSQLHGVLARQREIEKLELETAEQRHNLEGLRQQMMQAEQHYQSLEAQIAPLRTTNNELQQRLHDLQMQILRLNQAQERSAERTTQIERETQELSEQLCSEQRGQQDFGAQIAALREQLSVFQTRLDDAQLRVNHQELDLRAHRERAGQAQHALQEAHFFARTCAGKIGDLQQGLQRIDAAVAHSELNLAQLRTELAASADQTLRQQLQDALQLRQASEHALGLARNTLENATASLRKLECERLSCEHRLGPLREKLGEFTLKEQESRLHFRHWEEQLQGIDEQALAPRLESARPLDLQNELNRLNAAIEALGAVNLAAIEELQTVSERKVYLDAQAGDLHEAMATLEEAIRRIDQESRELLMETYNKVNQHLSELFPVLFDGGEARLVLSGEEILDSGVQVMAQPPGKKNSTIHLLSGGEKALTAIALVFAMFRLNPAPFCLLDEVDAPLDDTNTERLCALIRKMSQHTQFVFISHNKITMELAQQLIGVTMQEKGVSNVVTVDIEAALRMRDEPVAA